MRSYVGNSSSGGQCLDDPPPDVAARELQRESMRKQVRSDPAEFRELCARLARWPIITDGDVQSVASYLRKGPTSVIDPDRGVSRQLLREFQDALGLSRRYGITFNSATNALHAAYRAVGVGPGIKVAAIGYTFHATVTPALDLGGDVILMDVDPTTGNLTFDVVRRTLEMNREIRVVALNHNWGVPCQDIARIARLLKRLRVPLIEDCSHAHGASVNGESVGTHGTVSVFSLQSKKLVPAGEGGLCYTDDPSLKSAMLLVGHYFASRESHVVQVDDSVRQTGVGGLQCRMHPLAAALALSQLQRLSTVIRNRRLNDEFFRKLVADVPCIVFPEWPDGTRVSHYGCRAAYDPAANGDIPIAQFVDVLRRLGVPVEHDLGGPLSRKAIYQQNVDSPISRFAPDRHRYTDDDLPGAAEFCRRSLVFPVFSRNPLIMADVLEVIAEQIHAALSEGAYGC